MKIETTLLITGATGMIGGLLARQILERKASCQIVLPVREISRAEKLYSDLQDSDYQRLHFIETEIENFCSEQIPLSVDYIIHCACITQSAEMAAHPVETADSIVLGTKNILEIARKQQIKSMVYLSSMEVYGKMKDTGRLVGEDQLGDIDLQVPRSCYPMGKRMAEHYCCIYQQEYKVPVKIARLAQTFGQGVRPEDNRVYMQFARAAYENKDIVLKTYGTSMGNYCAIDDAIEGIFTILYRGKDGEAYNIVNEASTMQIRDMADLVAGQVAGGKIQVRIEPEDSAKTGYAPDTGLRLSGRKLRDLGWEPRKGLAEMYEDVMKELRNTQTAD